MENSSDVTVSFLIEEAIPEFFDNIWTSQRSSDIKNFKCLFETTAELAEGLGGTDILRRVADLMKDYDENSIQLDVEKIMKLVN